MEIVGAHHAERGDLLDMGVAIDAARKHQLPAGLDLASSRSERSSNRRDALAANADVGFEHIPVGCDRAAADDEIEVAHELGFNRQLTMVSLRETGKVTRKRLV